ncbi:cytochrome c biogenesis CcdA family protein [Demequina lutea]|uniref:Cytochrome c biogenesis protein CcdA n=1 Tax=Demequina lutea TaxID=431489 RepID=A0A7Y9Z8Q7_9MICO|nr:cytochrome c biogenesis protein CcdA [Demequina lutea]NYI40899.1 cytochrome c biogenesis protein CcdA [Demequina lutea]
MTVGYVVAFLGGVLTLASPCSAFLLPSFFAYAFPSAGRLLSRTLAFYFGLALALVPLGLGSGAVSQLVYGHRQVLFATAGGFLVALGIAQALGLGVRIPGLERLRNHAGGTSTASVVVLGAASGLTGFCTGPILGAVLTVAATSGSPLRGGSLLAVYAAGMTAPLFVLALLWQRLRLSERRLLRGRPVQLGRLTLHSTSLIGGVLVAAVGALFVVDRGGALTGGGFLSVDTEARLQDTVARLGASSDLIVLTLIALTALAVLVLRLRASRPATEPADR